MTVGAFTLARCFAIALRLFWKLSGVNFRGFKLPWFSNEFFENA